MRAFLAIPLPKTIADRLQALSAELASGSNPGAVRWVQSHSIHLTIKFLGEISSARARIIARWMDQTLTGQPDFSIRLRQLGAFPNQAKPRVIWLGVEDASGRLLGLQQCLEDELAKLGFAREGRSFKPHLTLGRVRDGARAGSVQQLASLLASVPSPEPLEFNAAGLTLFQSELKPGGALHHIFHRTGFALSAALSQGKQEG